MGISNSEMLFDGYKGANLDKFDYKNLKNILNLQKLISNDKSYIFLDNSILNLEPITWEEVRNIVIKFYADHFNVHKINYVEDDILDKTVKDMPDDTTPYEFYENINKILSSIEPFDLPIVKNENYDLDSTIIKPKCIYPGFCCEKNRKPYFSKIRVGRLLNEFTPVAFSHEIMHLETESVLGYTDEYLNREVLSIFIEKVFASEFDRTGKLLKIFEKMRFRDLINQYNKYLNNGKLSNENMIVSLTYIRSTLIAEKLFDMYLQEKKTKNRDKYIYDIQDIMDGKIKLEEMLEKRNITLDKCQDLSYLRRHI